MADDELKKFLFATKSKASTILDSDHVAAEVKLIIKDFLQVCDNFDTLSQQSSGQNADARLLKKRLDQSKTEMKALENKIDSIKKSVVSMIEDIKIASAEANAIIKRHPAEGDDPDFQSASKIKSSIQKLTEKVVSL
ncbi:MAG: hypothetical protein V4736_09405 [Bdellovibrionota bacterium]